MAVDDEPVLLRDHTSQSVVIGNLATQGEDGGKTPKGCYYEITISGVGLELTDADSVRVIAERYLVTPWHVGSRRGLVAQSLTTAGEMVSGGDAGSSLMKMSASVASPMQLVLSLENEPQLGERELVVDVRRVGRECAAPTVQEGL